jgi:hypothetical protein
MTEQPERNRKEASEYLLKCWTLSFAPNTLARLASTGRGAVYHHRGKFAFYAQVDLDTWALTKITAPRRTSRCGSPDAAT